MNYKDFNEAIATLEMMSRNLEAAYIENGGEITEMTEGMEQAIAAVSDLLEVEGTDMFGRWRTSNGDRIKMYKAEKAAADMRIKAAQKTEEFIDAAIKNMMKAKGVDKVKGAFYSFALYDSVKTTLNEDALNNAYLDRATEAIRAAGIPDCIDVKLVTTTTRLKEAGDEFAYFVEVTTAPAVRFTKPRNPKE